MQGLVLQLLKVHVVNDLLSAPSLTQPHTHFREALSFTDSVFAIIYHL